MSDRRQLLAEPAGADAGPDASVRLQEISTLLIQEGNLEALYERVLDGALPAPLVAPGRCVSRNGWLLTTRQRKYSGGLFRRRCFVSSHRVIGWASSHFLYW
jgi:hypothetical protein